MTLTVTSIADSSVSITSGPIAINPDTTLRVNFIPSLPSQMQTDATVNLTAAVAGPNDKANAGIDWQVCASGCGYFTIKPAIPAIPATNTTSYVPPVPAVTATTVSAWPNGLPIPYTSPSQVPTIGSVAVIALVHADTSKANSGTITISPVSSGPALNGVVEAGTQPVVGASLALYAAGTSGYGSASAQVISAPPTDQSGNFAIPAGYACPQPGSQMYLVATGGKVGSNDANPNRALMTALGSCSNLSAAPVIVNEVTTVASAFAIAPFSANDALTGNSSYLHIGASSSNLNGLANAFAAVNNLVDISTGKVRFTVPAGNAAVPYVEIDTLADFLNACAATSGGVKGDGSACSVLFTATDLLGTGSYNGSITPSDTLQAVFNIAQHPAEGSSYGYTLDPNENQKDNKLFPLATSNGPYQPILTQQPTDWSISLNYVSGGGLSSDSTVGSCAIDGSGNLWITDTKAGTVIEWNAVGAALSPSSGFLAGGGPIAIDASGNVWISGNGALTELTNLGSPLPWSPFGGVPGGGSDIAMDAQGDLWIPNSSGTSEFNNLGVQLSPSTGYLAQGVTDITSVGVDSSNNVWIGAGSGASTSNGYLAELSNPGGQTIVVGPPANSTRSLPGMAADSAGDIWLIQSTGGGTLGTGVQEIPPYAGRGNLLLPPPYVPRSANTGYDMFNMGGLALDGAGTVWVASQGSASANVPPSVLPIIPSLISSNSPLALSSSSLAAGPLRLAVDGSGNIWVLLSDNTITEYVGAATPVVTPLALGAQNKKFGAKP